MSVVAAAVVGNAVVGGYVANESSKDQSRATRQASDSAANVTMQTTQMQIDEISRQFDNQMQLLIPQVNRQMQGQEAFASILGLNQIAPGSTTFNYRQDGTLGVSQSGYGQPQPGTGGVKPDKGGQSVPINQSGNYFTDPNLDPTRLSDAQSLPGHIRNTRLAGDAGTDPYRNYIEGNRVAAGNLEDDLRFSRARDITTAGSEQDDLMLNRANNYLAAGTAESDMGLSRARDVQAAGHLGDDLKFKRAHNVRLAGDTLQDDVYRGDVASRMLADGAAGTGVYGEEFESSPGYSFQVEEMNRALDHRNSAGGNYGGEALREAMRQAQGLAATDYYNWASGRTQDLSRQAQAEATDASRLDAAGQNYMSRRAYDISRGDEALDDYMARRLIDIDRGDQATNDYLSRRMFDISRGDSATENYLNRRTFDVTRGDSAVDAYEQQRTMDISRQDAAMADYMRRREMDTSRMDTAIAETDRLREADMERLDQAYYNYLNNVGRVAGFGDAAGRAVSTAGQAGANTSNAYGQQGASLSSNYLNTGQNLANIEATRGANVNNAVQSGISNYMMYNYLNAA